MDKEVCKESNEQAPVSYAYFVYGVVPEFMPRFAFRREKHFKTVGRKIIKCPYCRNTFTTVDETDQVEIYPHSRKAKVVYDETASCKTCHRLVGVIYARARSA
jgi:transposase-like protein